MRLAVHLCYDISQPRHHSLNFLVLQLSLEYPFVLQRHSIQDENLRPQEKGKELQNGFCKTRHKQKDCNKEDVIFVCVMGRFSKKAGSSNIEKAKGGSN